ncbi:uncharacterized protein N7459_005655 [Penicillium hispanicum]|uniref:uncharacterized protein n=1 Tax=Penicillium hispanicum TaxID=1080232 RepID=UPI002540FCB4|nr:uncharacterized protein N7459_005655 [Penicillium hispanicum]KAJ5579670.1 hypothetical protein N7459_005655 [Penicillium hispanicum]
MHFNLPFLLGLAGAASASAWTVEAFSQSGCKGTMKSWSGDNDTVTPGSGLAGAIDTGKFYPSIVAQYGSNWTFSVWTGSMRGPREVYRLYSPPTNICQDTTGDPTQSDLSFSMHKH